ncbi:ABC transporter ATP-binding protein [Lachnospiraceae bacterium 45-W7]
MKKTVFRVLEILQPYKINIAFILLCSMLGMAGSFFQPLVIQNLTDQGILGQNYHLVLTFSVILISIILFQQMIEIIQNSMLMKLKKETLHQLHLNAFHKLLNLKISYFTSNNNAQIINQLNTDINCASIILDQGFFHMFLYVLKIFTGLAGLFYINWKMALCIIIFIPIKFLILLFFSNHKEKITDDSIQASRSFHSWMADRISGIREIKLLNRYENECLQFSKRKIELLEYEKKSDIIDMANSSAETIIHGILTAVYYILGGYYACKGEMSLGSVLAFISYSGNVTTPISMVMNIKMILAQIKPSFQRLEQFFDLEEEPCHDSEITVDQPEKICIENLSFGYEERKILKNISLTAQKGECIAIIGENGSGKSTLIQVLLKLYLLDGGKILLNGQDTEKINLKEYRSFFSVVTQSPYLFQETIRENIDPFHEYTDKEILEVLHWMKMDTLLHHFPQGLDTVIGVEGTNLSGGERQKIAFLRAVLRKTPILIFDESTSNFDKESEEWLFSEGLKQFKDKIVIFVTHRTEYLKYFDKVYQIKEHCVNEISKEGSL